MTLWFSVVKHSWFVVEFSCFFALLNLVAAHCWFVVAVESSCLLLLSLVGLLLFVELAPKRGDELDKAFADIESLLIL